MNRINILDCTLRDGGYVVDFNFGYSVIKEIIRKLSKASIDIIECGFLRSGAADPDRSLFGSIEDIKDVIGLKNPNLMYVAMIQYGAISIDEICPYDGTSVDGIRLTFHGDEIAPSLILGEQLMRKGYKVFMQPVGTATYSDEELLQLVKQINILKPFGFYLVDTLGTMYKNDLLRMFYLVDHNLDKKVVLGFHSHNNLQLSFANAQELMQLNSSRCLIIDSSVFGMGRGAGNLNTELVTQFINTNFGLQYDNLEILEILDEYIKPLSLKYRWGYDAAYYIASITGCHPNYAAFLMNQQTLHVQDIYAILSNLNDHTKITYHEDYIEKEYLKYMSHHVDDTDVQAEIRHAIAGKKVMLLAPGKSLSTVADTVCELKASGEYFVISVNFIPAFTGVDMVFISNMKRFSGIGELNRFADMTTKVVVTSNITAKKADSIKVVDYSSYTNEESCILDNAGLMCINFLKKIGIESILLAGFDGFSINTQDNYYEPSMYLDVEAEHLLQMNAAISVKIKQLRSQMKIEFLSTSAYS